jgi:hypothetical protein
MAGGEGGRKEKPRRVAVVVMEKRWALRLCERDSKTYLDFYPGGMAIVFFLWLLLVFVRIFWGSRAATPVSELRSARQHLGPNATLGQRSRNRRNESPPPRFVR